MNIEALKRALNTPDGQQLKAFLAQEVLKLAAITSIKPLDDPTELAIEVKAQQKAYEKVVHILGDLLDLPKPSTVKEQGHELIP
jgi:hypothetical protein